MFFIQKTASGKYEKLKNYKTWPEMKTLLTHSFEHSSCSRGMEDEYDDAEIIKNLSHCHYWQNKTRWGSEQ